MYRKITTAGVAAALMAVLMGSMLASTAMAQPALPYKAYGSGLRVGQVVQALKGTSTEVGRATVDANGNWSFDITPDKAVPGDVIRFTLDGAPTNQAVTFQNGQFPLPPGLSLTLAAGVAPTPAPAKTGSAGLAGQSAGTSMLLIAMLGVGALVAAAGARSMTRTR